MSGEFVCRDHYLEALCWRAHRRFMRRSNRSIAMYPTDHERLSALATEAAQLASRLRAEVSNRDSNRA